MGLTIAAVRPHPHTLGVEHRRFFAAMLAMVLATACSASSGAPGTECEENVDCKDSAAAAAIDDLRCAGRDIYCLNGSCHAECLDQCEAASSDVNPCEAPRLCVDMSGAGFCSIRPAACSQSSDCPAYLPPAPEGVVGAWTCRDGFCEYPGYDYPTR
jgi:hypothetical protein